MRVHSEYTPAMRARAHSVQQLRAAFLRSRALACNVRAHCALRIMHCVSRTVCACSALTDSGSNAVSITLPSGLQQACQ